MDGTFSGNTAKGSGRHADGTLVNVVAPPVDGFLFNGDVTGTVGGTAAGSENVAQTNTGLGFNFGGKIAAPNGKVQGNQANNNDRGGFKVAGTMDGIFSGNTAAGSGRNADGTLVNPLAPPVDGFLFASNVTGTVGGTAVGSGNVAQTNTGLGFNFGGNIAAASGKVQNNQANNNDGGGFKVAGTVDGFFTGNTASGSGRNADGTLVNALAPPVDGFSFASNVTGTVGDDRRQRKHRPDEYRPRFQLRRKHRRCNRKSSRQPGQQQRRRRLQSCGNNERCLQRQHRLGQRPQCRWHAGQFLARGGRFPVRQQCHRHRRQRRHRTQRFQGEHGSGLQLREQHYEHGQHPEESGPQQRLGRIYGRRDHAGPRLQRQHGHQKRPRCERECADCRRQRILI